MVQFGASPLFRVAVGVVLKSTAYRGESRSPIVTVRMYTISSYGRQDDFLGQSGVFFGGEGRREMGERGNAMRRGPRRHEDTKGEEREPRIDADI
jgi:hypothetical protein